MRGLFYIDALTVVMFYFKQTKYAQWVAISALKCALRGGDSEKIYILVIRVLFKVIFQIYHRSMQYIPKGSLDDIEAHLGLMEIAI